jgi:hypothetical protein
VVQGLAHGTLEALCHVIEYPRDSSQDSQDTSQDA